MPTYEYKCRKCGTVIELQHGFDEKPPKTCRANGCRGRLERQFSPPAIIFKGKGWYVTDHGRGNGKRPANGSNGKGDPAETVEKATEKAKAALDD